jgi:hypothetical protein
MVTRVTVYEETISAAFWPGGSIYANTRRIGKENRRIAASICPIRTGELLNSMSDTYVLPRGRFSHFYSFSVDTPYAEFVLQGTTGPIRPNSGKYMWMRPMPYSHMPFNTKPGTGGRWPFETVRGQKANDFMAESLRLTLYEQGLI